MIPVVFDIGDVVTLKSGGPKMTVSEINGNEVTCTWFDAATTELKTHVFKARTLEKDDDELDDKYARYIR